MTQINKGGTFLKNCSAALVREYNRILMYFQLSSSHKLATIKSFKADVLSISPLSKCTSSQQIRHK